MQYYKISFYNNVKLDHLRSQAYFPVSALSKLFPHLHKNEQDNHYNHTL